MTGERTFRGSEKIVPKREFLLWIDSLREGFRLVGPVKQASQTVFRLITSSEELHMEYDMTMLPPGKLLLFKPAQEMLRFRNESSEWGKGNAPIIEEVPPEKGRQVIIGLHPCDTNAVLYLDLTFLGETKDPYYEAARKNSFIISLNCRQVGPNCFCSSAGAGPFLKADKGYDMLLTDMGEDYLVELKSVWAEEIFTAQGRDAGEGEALLKAETERTLLSEFKKTINMQGLDKIFMENMDHPAWQRIADEKCLSCANCVMVCPTCFCYNIMDETYIDMKTGSRRRQWDACQDESFAVVHGGNFRQRRAARLRQFVTHKLGQTWQYGRFGTVGCGRCITWCPTCIDLTEIAKEMQAR